MYAESFSLVVCVFSLALQLVPFDMPTCRCLEVLLQPLDVCPELQLQHQAATPLPAVSAVSSRHQRC